MNKTYNIQIISKDLCKSILSQYHYLNKKSKGFRTGFNFGLYKDTVLVGVCVFHSPSVPETLKGCFGLSRTEQNGVYELGRLCLDPQIKENNILSWFVSRCIKKLKKETTVRSILSYADSSLHTGFIYQATNFKYYGLTDSKKDFWFETAEAVCLWVLLRLFFTAILFSRADSGTHVMFQNSQIRFRRIPIQRRAQIIYLWSSNGLPSLVLPKF